MRMFLMIDVARTASALMFLTCSLISFDLTTGSARRRGQNVGEVDNGAQGVVELMGDIARHHAHGHFAFPRAADVARASVERLGLMRYSHGSQPQPPASVPG